MDLTTEMETVRNRSRKRGENGLSDESVLSRLVRSYGVLACEYLVAGDRERAREYAALVVEADRALMRIINAELEAANG